jgi:transcriptional regulator with XRE-family HTH domain
MASTHETGNMSDISRIDDITVFDGRNAPILDVDSVFERRFDPEPDPEPDLDEREQETWNEAEHLRKLFNSQPTQYAVNRPAELTDPAPFVPRNGDPTAMQAEDRRRVQDMERIKNILEDSGISKQLFLVALMEASGIRTNEIARRLGKNPNAIYTLRWRSDSYKRVVRELSTILSMKVLDSQSTVAELFNSEIRPSVDTIVSLRDNLDQKGEVRLKAALGLLDRATMVPKVGAPQDNRSMTVVLPESAVANMMEALRLDGGESMTVLKDYCAARLSPAAPIDTPVEEAAR